MPSETNHLKKKRGNAIEGASFWEPHIKQFTISHLSRKAYCQEKALNYDRFQYWYHKFKKIDNNFIAVKIKPSNDRKQALCTLELSSGHRLMIHDYATLDFLLDRNH